MLIFVLKLRLAKAKCILNPDVQVHRNNKACTFFLNMCVINMYFKMLMLFRCNLLVTQNNIY